MMTGLFLIAAMLVDYKTRRFPWWLFITGICLWTITGVDLTGAIVGGLICLMADMPGGDVKFAIVFGAMIGNIPITVTLVGALMITLIAWKYGLTGVPWTVYVGVVYPIASLILHPYGHPEVHP